VGVVKEQLVCFGVASRSPCMKIVGVADLNVLCSNYYNLELSEIQVQGVSLNLASTVFNGKFGTVLDSGTTYAYLPNKAFEAFRDAVSCPSFQIWRQPCCMAVASFQVLLWLMDDFLPCLLVESKAPPFF
jgi:hypothetical protein